MVSILMADMICGMFRGAAVCDIAYTPRALTCRRGGREISIGTDTGHRTQDAARYGIKSELEHMQIIHYMNI